MEKVYRTNPTHISAAECGPRAELTAAALETRLIVAATEHADRLGVGFTDLIKEGNAWVLSRLSMEMQRMPRPHDIITVETWVESFNRHLSQRNFAILDAREQAIGYGRSLWTCINVESRRPASLKPLDADIERPCPIEAMPRLRPLAEYDRTEQYRFRYSDIDFNRHVNSARYVELIDNSMTLDWHLTHRMHRLDIAYLHEALYEQEAQVLIAGDTPENLVRDFDIRVNATTSCLARVTFDEINAQSPLFEQK